MSDRLFDPVATYASEADAPHTLGQVMLDHRGFFWMFILASNNLSNTRVVSIHQNYHAPLCANGNTDRGDRAGVVLHPISNTHLGWVCIFGQGNVRVAGASNNDQLYTDGTAGTLDNSSTSQTAIFGLGITANRSGTGSVNAIWTFPTWAH